MAAHNLHASVVVLETHGVLIEGPSGAGKSALALALIARWHARGAFAALVGDDQVFVEGRGGRLLCRTIPTIAGLVEIRGLGPVRLVHEPAAVIDLAVRLVEAGAAPRLAEAATITFDGVRVPRLDLALRDGGGAVEAVAACLSGAMIDN